MNVIPSWILLWVTTLTKRSERDRDSISLSSASGVSFPEQMEAFAFYRQAPQTSSWVQSAGRWRCECSAAYLHPANPRSNLNKRLSPVMCPATPPQHPLPHTDPKSACHLSRLANENQGSDDSSNYTWQLTTRLIFLGSVVARWMKRSTGSVTTFFEVASASPSSAVSASTRPGLLTSARSSPSGNIWLGV